MKIPTEGPFRYAGTHMHTKSEPIGLHYFHKKKCKEHSYEQKNKSQWVFSKIAIKNIDLKMLLEVLFIVLHEKHKWLSFPLNWNFCKVVISKFC